MDQSEHDDLRSLSLRFVEAFNQGELDDILKWFAADAVYVSYDGKEHRGKSEIREAFVPQFRGDFGKLRFEIQDVIADPSVGMAVVRWRCFHEMNQEGGYSTSTKLKRLFFRGMFGSVSGWYGLDVLRFDRGLVLEKRTYAQTQLLVPERNVG